MIHKKYRRPPYIDRDGRNRYIAMEFKEYIGRAVLNVGGGGMHVMRKYLPPYVRYHEIDIFGAPDIRIDLEKDLPIPVEDNSYDTVICTDVLEHLDNMHKVVGELVRVSKRYIIISLPNPLESLMAALIASKFQSTGKFYGLPRELPCDRHKWFFSAYEASQFLIHWAVKKNLVVREHFTIGYYGYTLKGKIIRSIVGGLLGSIARANLFVNAIWVVYEKNY